MKFLVLGCNGMAGHVISLYLHEKGHDVTGFAMEPSKLIPTIVGDATDAGRLIQIIGEGNYDAVLNCIGLLNQYAENNKEKAVYLNSYLPHFLADVTEKMKTQIIHMSTDCVFSGKKGAYTENDLRDGETFYDRTKALGELEDNKNLTLRNSIVGPDINEKGIGLLNWFMKNTVTDNGFVPELTGYTKAVWTGQTTLQLAKTMERAAEYRVSGLINMVPDCSITKFELLNLFNKYLRDNKVTINPVDGIAADKSLVRSKFEFDYLIPDYEVMVSELAQWMKNHKNLYPHYCL